MALQKDALFESRSREWENGGNPRALSATFQGPSARLITPARAAATKSATIAHIA
jgi:hypothetical protein